MANPTQPSDTTVLYFNRGTSNYVRMLVSIFSLRRHYSGLVTVMQEGELHTEITGLLDCLNVTVQPVPVAAADHVLIRKASLWRELRHNYAMYIDADTIICGSVDEFLGWIKTFGFVATSFNDWSTTGPRMQKRILHWENVAPELVQPALAYGKAINSGVMGWSKAAALLPAYEELSRRGYAAKRYSRLLDEIALQLLLPHHQHYLAHHRWNTSGKYGNINEARIIHYHGKKHCRDSPKCEVWKQHYFELLASFPDHTGALQNTWGDKRLRRYLKKINHCRSDMTVVTAVNPSYAEMLRVNLKKWMHMPGLSQQRFLVLMAGFEGANPEWLCEYSNVEVVQWDYKHAEAGVREFMLAAFIFGVAKHVKTEYWMKLDADCSPKRAWWEWPEYSNYTIVSHRWGYTRMKGESCGRHWFNRLDDIFSPDNPLFNQQFEVVGRRCISHRPGNPHGLAMRFASFCHIEKTVFTQRMATLLDARNDGRMAIPSQDTTSWYCAQLWSEKVLRVNMKIWFTP